MHLIAATGYLWPHHWSTRNRRCVTASSGWPCSSESASSAVAARQSRSSQCLRWYRGALESHRAHGFKPGIRNDIGWLAFSLWAAASRWLFLVALAVTVATVGHMSFSPWLLALFVFASAIRIVQVRELGLKYKVMAKLMVEELYYAFFLFTFTISLAVAAISTVGFSVVWGIFAVTLFVTTAVAIHRSIPRAER